MNMESAGMGALDLIVFAAMAFTALFAIAWGVSPGLRVWIEKPKYQFQRDVEEYEESVGK